MFNRTAILLGQYFPLAGLLVPHAGLVAIRGLVEQGDAADAQELVGLLVPILVQARLVGFDGAAEALLDLVGLEDLAVLLGDGDVGPVHEIGQGRHAVLTLHLLERQVQETNCSRESIILSIKGTTSVLVWSIWAICFCMEASSALWESTILPTCSL